MSSSARVDIPTTFVLGVVDFFNDHGGYVACCMFDEVGYARPFGWWLHFLSHLSPNICTGAKCLSTSHRRPPGAECLPTFSKTRVGSKCLPMTPDEQETSLGTTGHAHGPFSKRTAGDVPWDFLAVDYARCLSPTLESVVLIPKASTLMLDPTVPTLTPLEDFMEPLKVKPLVFVLAPKVPTHVLTLKASTLDALEDVTEPLVVEPPVCLLGQTVPTLVLTSKASTHDPFKDLIEPLTVEPSATSSWMIS